MNHNDVNTNCYEDSGFLLTPFRGLLIILLFIGIVISPFII